jgi:hypothetical protein
LSLTPAFSQSKLQQADQQLSAASFGSLNINNMWLKIRNDGIGQRLTYPRQYGSLLESDNLIWVGKVYDGRVRESAVQMPELRTGGGIWEGGVRPGSIISKGVAEDTNSNAVRVFRYRPDFLTADLRSDVAASTGTDPAAATPEMVTAARADYAKDLAEWPWQKGAPFVDKNQNGIMDGGEVPGIQSAGQIAWFSYNDLDEAKCKSFAGDPSIGLEVQVTLWGYQGIPNLDDVIFKRYRVIYKGTSFASPTSQIDSMYFSQWCDLIIGDYFNDLGGCDSALSLAYQFNGDIPDPIYRNLGGANPAVGYALLQGPLVPGSANESGISDFTSHTGVKNLQMTSYMLNPTGDPINEPTNGSRTFWYWNLARGFAAWTKDLTYHPYVLPNGQTTKFMYSGDPVSKVGWIDGLGRMQANTLSAAPGYRRFTLSTGPFTMALGDTQEVVLALIGSHATEGVENVTWLRNRTRHLHEIYPNLGDYVAGFVTDVASSGIIPSEFALDQNFPNPFNPSTQIRFRTPQSGQVKLSIFDLLGQETRELCSGVLSAGEHTIRWDGRDSKGEIAPSGVYFYRLTQGERHATRKLLLLR